MSKRQDLTTQYHHYIPRFTLRNFAHPFLPQNVSGGHRQRNKHKRQKGHYPGDEMIYAINLAGTEPQITETSVARTFGQMDMYRDFANTPNQHEVEQKLSRLESNAARIIQKIRKEYEAQKKGIWISRSERDTLRKFLFIMKYRGPRFRRRFDPQLPDEYSEDDAEQLRAYMREKGYKRPVDVWFDNIKVLVDLKMDPEMKWANELMERIYPADAMWAISNMQSMYLSICTPSSQEDEFLLTENSYSIHEGPNSPRAYTEFHVFAVISPKLIIVLRSFLLPVPEEDQDPNIKEWRQELYALNAAQHIYPSHANSCLQDLPVRKARNSYSEVVNGRVILTNGKDRKLRPDDKFCFEFFPITTTHVNKINSIMLEESHSISTIAFKSKSSARKALEFHLTTPTVQNEFGKKIFETLDDPRLVCYKKLEQAAKQLGSDIAAKCLVIEEEKQEKLEQLIQSLENNMPSEPADMMKTYMKLGGSIRMYLEDIEQARRMLNLRIKIDVWCGALGIGKIIREEILENLRDLFCQLPPRRLWHYLKNIRYIELKDSVKSRGPNSLDYDGLVDGPEDVIANMCQLFRPEDLGRMMYFATLNQIYLTKNADFGHAFGPAGSICSCGIPAVEDQARAYLGPVLNIPKQNLNPFWSELQNHEMAVRVLMRDELPKILNKRISTSDLKLLDDVLFRLIFPTIAVDL